MNCKHIIIIAALATLAACNNADKNTTDADNTATTVTETPAPTTEHASGDGHDHGAAGGSEETHQTEVIGAGPHQGIITHASSGHIEMVLEGKDAVFYPLDARTEPINANGWNGKAVIQYKGGNSKNVTLNNKNGKLIAEGVNNGETFKAIVTLTNNDQSTTATFNTSADADGHTGHSHGEGEEHKH